MSPPAHPTTRRLAAGALAAVTGLLLAGGCGVPSGSDVRVDGPMPDAGSLEDSDPPNPPHPNDANTETQLVDYFLQAAAGNPAEPVERLREFIHSEQRRGWEPAPQIVVVRTDELVPTEAGDELVRVEVQVKEVGLLTEGGIITPSDGPTEQLTFHATQEPAVQADGEEAGGLGLGESVFRLVEPLPKKIMLSQAALEDYLEPRPLYFWGSDSDQLVPDLRWLPSALPERQRAQTMLEWLEDGPAPWLQGAVEDLPEDVALAGNAVWSRTRLDVTLTAAAADIEPASRLDAQLWWTLRPELGSGRELVLTIDGQERAVGEDYQAQNPATQPPPARFAVVDGVIRQQQADDQIDLPALAGDGVNAGVHSAAMTRNRRSAALVREEPDGRYRLVIVRPDRSIDTDLVRPELHRPVWLASGPSGLVAAGGELHRFTPDGEVSPVSVPGNLGGISAVAASPDARRLALVAGGELYVASMAWQDGAFTVSEPRLLPTTLNDLSGVGFYQEDWLAVVGKVGSESLLYEITVDGALEKELVNGSLGRPPRVENFVSYPGDPTGASGRGDIMYEYENRAYRYSYGRRQVQIHAEDLYEVSAEDGAGDPRAPFFLD